jgi:hypothetical protein
MNMAIEIVPNLTGSNVTGILQDITNATGTTVPSLEGNLGVALGGAILVIAAFIFYKVVKDLLANVIIGAIALIIVTQVLKVGIPLNVATILVSLIFGIGGVGALMILTYLGALNT